MLLIDTFLDYLSIYFINLAIRFTKQLDYFIFSRIVFTEL